MIAQLLILALLNREPLVLRVSHSGDYGPLGDGPSFSLDYVKGGNFRFSCHRWKIPDGEYALDLSPDEKELVLTTIRDIEETSSDPPEFWICPHSPDFGITHFQASPPREFVTTVCVSRVRNSRLGFLFELVERLGSLRCVPTASRAKQ
jgi:hypothetical protein